MAKTKQDGFDARKARVRRQLAKYAKGRPRLSVYRSGQNIYAQVIDDLSGRTLAAASSLEKDVKSQVKAGYNVEAATAVGKAVAERAGQAGVKDVVFDRGGYRFHGRIKALADAAREAGLNF